MIEIKCVIADKRLVQTLRALKGLTLEPPVFELADEEFPKQKLPYNKGSHTGASAHVDLFLSNIKKAGAKTITGKQLNDHMKMGGFRPYSYGYRIHQLLKEKVLKHTKVSGVYEVVR